MSKRIEELVDEWGDIIESEKRGGVVMHLEEFNYFGFYVYQATRTSTNSLANWEIGFINVFFC